MSNNFLGLYKNKKVLITGHTGFKGAWLSQILLEFEAKLAGIALKPKNNNDLYNLLRLEDKMISHIFDLRDIEKLEKVIIDFKPDFIFHLAAQSLVLDSYQHPYNTISTNIISTLNILELLKRLNLETILVNVTSDKCYENTNQAIPFKEGDPLGGIDPYSASKAMVEILANSYNQSFFKKESKVKMFSVRAGNVFGGGDWAANRLVPDIIKNMISGAEIYLRNPESTRPWQHVLEPLGAYLQLAAYYYNLDTHDSSNFSDAWNIAPGSTSQLKVVDFVKVFIRFWGDENIKIQINREENKPYEAKTLGLSSEKIIRELGWRPKLNIQDAIKITVDWYKACVNLDNVELITKKQINEYFKKLNQTVS
ncbi:MAG: CDP-glucose 4,6-dehydratase [Candidatus Caenarcaniphilales bacterium]|nr:CDP-glucose 4,6-dehydratase [Candidatus Caenarcaniphilales bacterium]